MSLFLRKRKPSTGDKSKRLPSKLPLHHDGHRLLVHPKAASSNRKLFQIRNIVCSRTIIANLVLSFLAIVCAFYSARFVVDYRKRPHYNSRREANFREFRFPDVDTRVRAYMSDWYLPPCSTKDRVTYKFYPDTHQQQALPTPWWTAPTSWWPRLWWSGQTGYFQIQPQSHAAKKDVWEVSNKVAVGRISALHPKTLLSCFQNKSSSIRFYCSDAMESLLHESNPPVPILMQPGDETDSVIQNLDNILHTNPRIPHFKKIRHAMSPSELERILDHTCRTSSMESFVSSSQQLQPIVWKLNARRHYGYLDMIKVLDRPWAEKLDKAVFRGTLTGNEYQPHASDEENCLRLPRCRLVYQYHQSSLLDAKLTTTADRMPNVIRGVPLTGKFYWREDMLAHKGIVILEGNDVASGLKWAMLSKSVVIMPPPTKTSFALEEFLEPWIHYIPLEPSLQDVDTKIEWMIAHQAESRRISHRATLWIMDLVFHPDVAREERLIQKEILKRYGKHFQPYDG